MQKVKAALLTHLAQLLLEDAFIAQASVAFDLDVPAIADNVALEVLTSTGYAYRLRVHQAYEKVLLDRQLKDPAQSLADRKLVNTALAVYQLRFVARSRHHAALSVLHHRFTSMSAATRLTKRWISSHLLYPHFATEWIELLVAEVYLNPGSRGPPGNMATGFARVLERLKHWRYAEEFLCVPLYSIAAQDPEDGQRIHFSQEKFDQARSYFNDHRRSDPLMHRGTMLIVTEEDLRGTEWGWDRPHRMFAQRLVSLASASLDLMEASGCSIQVLVG